MKEYADDDKVLVADVDCDGAGKSLCRKFHIRGFPSLKYGDPDEMKDYKGKREWFNFMKHCESLKPPCGPANMDFCEASQKKLIEEFRAMDGDERQKLILEKEQAIATAEKTLSDFTEGLNQKYKEETAKKEAAEESLKKELDFLQVVHSVLKVPKTRTEL